MSVNSKMTAIADKIRSLLGLSDEMGLDDMAENLGTALANVEDCCEALTAKGVDVGSAPLPDIPGLIAQIPAGGGSSLDTCTVTFNLSEFVLHRYSYIAVDTSGSSSPVMAKDVDITAPYRATLSGVLHNSFLVLIVSGSESVGVTGDASVSNVYPTSIGTVQIIRISGDCTINNPTN